MFQNPLRLFLSLGVALLALGFQTAPVQADEPEAKTESKDAAKPAAPRKPFLWVVDSKPRLYLFGTIHVGDARVLDHPPVVKRALDESGVLLTEIDMADMTPAAIMPKLMLPDGQTLKQVLDADLYVRLEKKLATLGMPMVALERMKPFAIFSILQLAGLKPEQKQNVALDQSLSNDAKARGRIVGGLETVDEQLGIFDSLTMAEQGQLISGTLDAMEKAEKDGGASPIQGLIDLYLTGDVEALGTAISAETEKGGAFAKKFMKSLLGDRNIKMADRMIKRLADHPDKVHFVAVGVAHYPGKQGILALLRKKGFTVWRATSLKDLEGPPKAQVRDGTSASRRAPARQARRRYVRVGPFCLPLPARRCCPGR